MSTWSPGLPLWMELLGQALLHLVWQGGIVGLVWLLLSRSLPRTGNVRYAVGLALLAVLALLPVFTLVWLQAHAAPAVGVAGAGLAGVSLLPAQPRPGFLPWVVVAWFAGVGLGTARMGVLWWRMRRVVLRHSRVDARLDGVLEGLARRFGVLRARLRVTDRVDTPMLVGWFRPVILLPLALALGLPRRNLELVLAHELAHLRRLDPLANLFQLVVETLLFYHPVVHWISRDVRRQRELCCDRLVLQVLDDDPVAYAHTLLRLEEARQPRLVMAASGGDLLERVRELVDPAHVPAAGAVRLPLVIAALALVMGLMLMQARTRVLVPDMPGPTWSWVAGDDAWSLPLPRPPVALPEPVPLANPDGGEDLRTSRADEVDQAGPAQSAVATVADAMPALDAGRLLPEPTHAAAAPPAALLVEAVQPATPVATRADAPVYRAAPGTGRERVRLEFSVGADGRVRDVEIISGGEYAGFARAAHGALQKWRFDPATLPETPVRYVQEFVFEPPASGDDIACARRTGSHLCRR